jgi:predicted unusual protein kinase regulating ubiquinone biosynthesis (AarF/ABC1/UbiB family)
MKSERKWFRTWKILSFAFSVFIRVYWFRIFKKPASEQERLWGRIGQEFRSTLFELEGLLIKVGQFLSIRADLLPGSFVDQLQDLVDQVPPSPWEDIKKVLEKEWNGRVEDCIHSIDPVTVASASIGEVYRGKLKDGTKVAVKVQRPTISSIIRTDFRSLAIIIWFADHFVPVPKGFINFKLLFKELKTVIGRELDFKKEMETIIHFRDRFNSFEKITIPKVFPELCTSQVLVMEWVEGVRITDGDFLMSHEIDREELSQRLLRIFIPQWLEAGIFHADPHAGNVLVKTDGSIILLDFGMVGEISKKDASNFQRLLEAFLIKNYSMIVEVLKELGFLLPEANSKTVETLIKEAFSIDLTALKEMDLFKVKKELNEMIKSLPVQVPTRFIFLGRSFITIEGMLYSINPNQEFLEIAKPPFIDWLNQSNQNKWKLVLKWINSQPIFKIFHSVFEMLDTPKKYIESRKTEQQRGFYFSIYENQKKQSFFLGLLGLVGLLGGTYLEKQILLYLSIGITGVSFFAYIFCIVRQRKWLNKIEKK